MIRKAALLLISSLLFISAFSLGLLNDISISPQSGKTEIKLSMDKVANFTDFSITAPDVIVFDLIAIDNGLPGFFYNVNNGSGVKSVELIKDYETNFLRVMIEVDKKYSYSKEYVGNNIIITLDNGVSPQIGMWKASTSEAGSKGNDNTLESYNNDFLITMDVENADVVTLLRGLAEYTKINLVMSNAVSGRVTVHVKEVPWKDLFDMVTRLAGLTYDEYPNMIRVGTFSEFAKEQTAMQDALPLDIKVYQLEFAKPQTVSSALKPVLSKRGVITIDDRTNSIVVKDIQDVHSKIQKIVETLDKKNLQVEIVVKVVEMTKKLQKDLGVKWTLSNIGSTTTSGTGGVTTNTTPMQSTVGAGVVTIGTVTQYGAINAQLDALEIAGKSKTLSNPRVTATNNTKAEILGGTEFFVNTVDVNGNVGSTPYTVGTILSVTPHVNSTRDITLEIEAELSTVENPTSTPVINTTKASTIQMVRDGETVVMGGFILNSESRTETGLPFIRSIPIIGHLFKTDNSLKNEKEVLIFITPHIIRDIE